MQKAATTDLYRQFSGPFVPFNQCIHDEIVWAHAKAVTQLFLTQRQTLIQSKTEGVIDYIQGWLLAMPKMETLWDPAIGLVQWALESDEPDTVDVSLRLALKISEANLQGCWQGLLSNDIRLRWGNSLMPKANRIEVENDGGTAVIHLSNSVGGSHHLLFYKINGSWIAPAEVEQLPVARRNQSITILPEYAIHDFLTIEDQFGSITAYPDISREMVDTVQNALQILGDFAPDYLGWIERVIRGIVICRCKNTRTRSSTWSEAPGIILMSETNDPMAVAEMLVHEASHQYYHLLAKVGEFDDGTDQNLYYSPAVCRERPLSRILIAFHAFANVVLMYRDIRLNSNRPELDRTDVEAKLAADVLHLETPLLENPALTALGLALFLPLSEKMHKDD